MQLSIGQCSNKGGKPINQDFYACALPSAQDQQLKGVVCAVSDGVSSSDVSQVASQIAVTSLIEDYYATPSTWSVKKSAGKVIRSINAWLHSQTISSHQHHDKSRGFACTLTAMILKAHQAHIFHIGDSRIYRLGEPTSKSLEVLTQSHRFWVQEGKYHLSRALGVDYGAEVDYQSIAIQEGELFLMLTDGVFDFCEPALLVELIHEHQEDMQALAEAIVEAAIKAGSDDNLTAQIIRIDSLDAAATVKDLQYLKGLPLPNHLYEGEILDHYRILDKVSISDRSRLYYVRDINTQIDHLLKLPSQKMVTMGQPLEHFMLEEWITTQVTHPNLLNGPALKDKRRFFYIILPYISGQKLSSWLKVRDQLNLIQAYPLMQQLANAVQALHQMDILHQDIRPNNIMISANNHVTLVDYGSARVMGISESNFIFHPNHLPGTGQYMAPEYFLGYSGTPASDIYSLGVVIYYILTREHPYNDQVRHAKRRSAQKRLKYQSMLLHNTEMPHWIDLAIKKAVHIDPNQRYQTVNELLQDLSYPNLELINAQEKPKPLMVATQSHIFWQWTSVLLLLILIGVIVLG